MPERGRHTMTVIAEFTIPTESFPFGDTLATMSDTKIEVERVVPTQESALPFFWVWGSEPKRFLNDAETEPNVSAIHLLAEVKDGALFQAEWTPDTELIEGVKRLDATIVKAIGTAEYWHFKVRTQDQTAFADFEEIFKEQGISVDLNRLCDIGDFVEGNYQFLTSEQQEALITAYEEGYYEKPRQTTQEALGEEFGISHRAVSERLRRGTRNIIREGLISPGRYE